MCGSTVAIGQGWKQAVPCHSVSAGMEVGGADHGRPAFLPAVEREADEGPEGQGVNVICVQQSGGAGLVSMRAASCRHHRQARVDS